jgi:hypothetical protein
MVRAPKGPTAYKGIMRPDPWLGMFMTKLMENGEALCAKLGFNIKPYLTLPCAMNVVKALDTVLGSETMDGDFKQLKRSFFIHNAMSAELAAAQTLDAKAATPSGEDLNSADGLHKSVISFWHFIKEALDKCGPDLVTKTQAYCKSLLHQDMEPALKTQRLQDLGSVPSSLADILSAAQYLVKKETLPKVSENMDATLMLAALKVHIQVSVLSADAVESLADATASKSVTDFLDNFQSSFGKFCEDVCAGLQAAGETLALDGFSKLK